MAAVVAGTVAAAAAGASVAGNLNSLMNPGVKINCYMGIQNLSKFSLTEPVVTLRRGQTLDPPAAVLPSKTGSSVFCKTAWSSYGTSGAVSWLVKDVNVRIFVAWFVPYTYVKKSNWLAVGISPRGSTNHDRRWMKEIYKEDYDSIRPYFHRKEYKQENSRVFYEDDTLQIEGIMGTKHNTTIKIIIHSKAEPIVEQPVVEQPVVEPPILQQPVLQQPVLQQPILYQPILYQPILYQPILHQPVLHQPAMRPVSTDHSDQQRSHGLRNGYLLCPCF